MAAASRIITPVLLTGLTVCWQYGLRIFSLPFGHTGNWIRLNIKQNKEFKTKVATKGSALCRRLRWGEEPIKPAGEPEHAPINLDGLNPGSPACE